MKKLILIMLLAIGAFANEFIPYYAIGMNWSSFDTKGLKLESPSGKFGLKYIFPYGAVDCKHTSSIPQMNESQGLNECGAELNYKLSFMELFIARYVTNDKLSSKYYLDQIGKYSTEFGFRLKHEYGDIQTGYRKEEEIIYLYSEIVIIFDPSKWRW